MKFELDSYIHTSVFDCFEKLDFLSTFMEKGEDIPVGLRRLVNAGAKFSRRCSPASFADLSAAWPSQVSHSDSVKKQQILAAGSGDS